MSLIIPDTTIDILSGIPLDNTYTNSVEFASAGAQQAYFSGKAKFIEEKCTYQRQNGRIRIERTPEELFDCNYIMFQNSGFPDNKWFYAFITKPPLYINNECCEIEFELDQYQTWLFDWEFKPCMVKREHDKLDILFDNLEPEPVKPDISEYRKLETASNMTWEVKPLLWTAVDGDGTAFIPGHYYGDILGGCTEISDESQLRNILNAANDPDNKKAEKVAKGIADLYMAPADFITSGTTRQGIYPPSKSITCPVITAQSPLGSYTHVKNRKLYSSPFNELIGTNYEGQQKRYRYEFFHQGSVNVAPYDFKLYGCAVGDSEIICLPLDYNGIAENFDEKIILNSYPTCPWTTNAYGTWKASQNTKTGIAMALTVAGFIASIAAIPATSGASTGLTAATVAKAGALTTAAQTVAGLGAGATLAKDIGARMEAGNSIGAQQQGSFGGTNAMTLNGLRRIDFYQKFPSYFECERLDNFFSVYGYATNKIKIPNTPQHNGRPHWNYVKLENPSIIPTHGLPVDAISSLKEIFTNGIHLWRSPSEVGDFSLDNSVGGTPAGRYDIIYRPNGGSGTMPNGIAYEGVPYLFPNNGYIPPADSAFNHWEVTQLPLQEFYPGDSLLVTENLTVMPVWSDIPWSGYTVIFNANGGRTVLGAMPNGTAQPNVPYVLPVNDRYFPPVNKVFINWLIAGQNVNAGNSIVLTSDSTAKAIWARPVSQLAFFLSVVNAQLGKPYVGGGNGPNNFDCSGLLYYCLNMSGYVIGDNTANGYANNSEWVKVDVKADLREGDLVFFWNAGQTRIQHCGVFIGNDRMIHASTSSPAEVKEVSFSGYTALVWAWGRRVNWI